jgi:hypothetical protein
LHQYAYELGQVARLENQIAIHDAGAAKENQRDIKSHVMRLEGEVGYTHAANGAEVLYRSILKLDNQMNAH